MPDTTPPAYQLTPVPALGTTAERFEKGGYALVEATGLALASLASRTGSEAKTAAWLKKLLGTDAPGPGMFVEGRGYTAFWMGPDQWMVLADHDGHELLAHEINSGVGNAASVTEQNDGWVCLDVTGPDLPTMFERLMMADTGDMIEGKAVRTVIEHVGCFVLCVEEGCHYRICALRSYGRSLHHTLIESIHSTVAIRATNDMR